MMKVGSIAISATILLTVLLAWGCNISTTNVKHKHRTSSFEAQASNQETAMINPLSSTDSVRFVPGPSIDQPEHLLHWLNNESESSTGSKRLLRLPVVIHFEDSYRLALGDSFIGVSDTNRDDNAIFLLLDDSSMGVSLLSELTQMCPEPAQVCTVWLEGYWGLLLDFDLPELEALKPNSEEEETKEWLFSVLKVQEVVTHGDNIDEPIRVFIEASP